MANELQKTTNEHAWLDLKTQFGEPPVLSTESSEAYDAILAGLVASHKPWDCMSKMLVRQMADFIWHILRYERHKSWTIERRHRKRVEFQARRAKAAADKKKARAEEVVEKTNEGSPELNRLLELLDVHESTYQDVDDILNRSAEELDHAQALEDGIDYYERLDDLRNSASRGLKDTFRQFCEYREATAWQNQQLREIIDAEFTEAGADGDAPVVPAIEDTAP